MITIEKSDVYGLDHAIRGMRNALESWDKIDSEWVWDEDTHDLEYVVGKNDLKRMKSLAAAGDDHGKYLRYIDVWCDITAPLYFWREYETYRIGTAENPSDTEFNSCSTMHKIHAKEFTLNDFCRDQLLMQNIAVLQKTIDALNDMREEFLQTNDKVYWYQLIQLLPQSYMQKRTLKASYQALRHMYFARKDHKLEEWREVCRWIESLPCAEIITYRRPQK